MNTRKHLLSAARLVLPTIGLSLIFAGAYISSIQTEQLPYLRDISTYLLIILGFILLVAGVLWSLGHGMKNGLLKHAIRMFRDTDVEVFTIDRSQLQYPPSYEESQIRNTANEVDPTLSIPPSIGWIGSAPPIYTETSCENLVEDFSHEAPPTYQQAGPRRQTDSQAAHRLPNSSAEPL